MKTNYIAYYRVSTKKQNLGLNAQETNVMNYINNNNGKLIASFSEKESGKNNNRIELNKALELCEKKKATLIVAKLDRLSREVSFIFDLKSKLDKNKINFVCVDLPDLNTLTLGIFATMAQHERELISKRTKEGLKAAKQKGKKLGYDNDKVKNRKEPDLKAARRKHTENSKQNENNRKGFEVAILYKKQGLSYAKIAEKMNNAGFKAPKGGNISAIQVKRMIEKYS
jgi:DNA invertase Pin-like site-specific DNA recombinase